MRLAMLCGFGVLTALAASAAQAQSVQQTFEQNGLLGRFAVDCAAQASGQNRTHVHRVIDDGHVEVDQMTSATKRDFTVVFDRVLGSRPNELAVSGTINGQRYSVVFRIDGARKRTMESMKMPDEKRIAAGRRVDNGEPEPWFTRCERPANPGEAAAAPDGGVQALFEKYNLLGHFAWDCSKPPNRESNWYFINRAVDAGHIRRDYMSGPTTRGRSFVIDKVVELRPNEITVSGTSDGQTVEGIWRTEPGRMRQWTSTRAGNKQIVDGRWVSTGLEMPWLNRCAGR